MARSRRGQQAPVRAFSTVTCERSHDRSSGAVAQVNEARSAVEAALAADRLNSLGGTFGDRYSAVLAELLLVDAREAKASWDERFAV